MITFAFAFIKNFVETQCKLQMRSLPMRFSLIQNHVSLCFLRVCRFYVVILFFFFTFLFYIFKIFQARFSCKQSKKKTHSKKKISKTFVM